MAHFLLAWELGANLGHATRLRSIALALSGRGHRVTFALRDVVGCRDLLGPDLGHTLQAPLFLGPAPAASWSMADVLLSCGHADARTLQPLAQAWQAIFALSGCDALVADHAPTALLAARMAGLPAMHVGHGFSLPPRVSPLPVFRDWASPPPGYSAAEADARALGAANAVLHDAKAPPLARLCDLFYPERTALCSWPELDHYGGIGRSTDDYLGPDCDFAPGATPVWPAGPGPRVFAYLRAGHPEHATVLAALAVLGWPTVCFIPDAPDHGSALPPSPTIHYSRRPLDMRLALADCSLVICHAGQATVAQALLAGVPSLLMPLQAEQFLLARQLEQSGAALNAARLARPLEPVGLLRELGNPDGRWAVSARALAARHGSFDRQALAAHIADAAAGLIATAP